MLLMWVGRLEITLALVFLTPAFWRDVRFSLRASRKGMRIKKV
jgi:Trk-type K+ transport system membrane component